MKATRYLVLGLLTILALSVNARMYEAGEDIFVNVNQSGIGDVDSDIRFDWSVDNAKIFLYFYQNENGNNNEWIELSPVSSGSKVYYGSMHAYHPWYNRVIVVRKSSSGTAGNWDNKWNQSCDIEIPENSDCDCNYLEKFTCKDGVDKWQNLFAPPAAGIKKFADRETADKISICPSALGGPISLRPKLIVEQDTIYYNYDEVRAHAWYVSTNGGSTWTAKDALSGHPRSDEDYIGKDLFDQLPTSISTTGIYYYLYSTKPAGRHLIHILNDAPKCDLDCEITAFETAVSSVNADDNTYTLDGMVAFGKASGSLVISCDNRDTTISAPISPQSFSLHGVPAATENGKKTTVTAYFTGDQTHCTQTLTIDVPNAKEAVEVKTIDALTKTTIELKPTNCDPSNDFVWIINGHEYWKADGAQQQWTIPNSLITADIMKDSVFSCIYKEYLPAPGTNADLMKDDNGKYEATDGYGNYGEKSTMSDYDFWGRYTTTVNFYADTLAGGINPLKLNSNGFAVVRNANNFAPTYAKVEAHQGSQFALFDAATGKNSSGKKAWYAETANNENLKLKKGTTYVLSFWAANINNYGEMDNAAQFKFYIEDITNPVKPQPLDSSEVLDLSQPEYRNNLWHQCSKTYTAKADCDNVRISVVNLNKRNLIIGNDFALDDIQFHPISVVSKVVKSQQQFNVTVHEPKVTAFTATTLPLNCDEGPEYKVAVEVKYKNPNSKLVIEDSAPNVGNRHEYTLPAIAYETEGVLRDTITVTTNHHSYTWHTYFKEWTTAEATATTPRAGLPRIDTAKIAFSEPACTDLKTTLSFDLKYRFQSGTLQYWVDNLAKQQATFSANDTAERTLPLTIEGIDADGKATHKLHISFSGEHSCIKEYTLPAVPLSPVIDKVEITSTLPQVVSCSTTNYEIEVKVTTLYAATGQQVVLFYDNNGTDETSPAFTVNDREATTTITVNNIANGQHYIKAAFANRQECTKDLDPKYTAPRVAQISNFDVTPSALKCDETKYTISGSIAFDLLDGNVSDGNLIVEFDADHRQVIASPTSSPVDFTIANMTAEGSQLFVTAWFSGSEDDACKKVSGTFDSPGKPSMDTANIAYSEPTCTDLTTTLTFDLNYTYQQGTLTYKVDDLSPVTLTPAEYGEKDKTEQTKTLTFADIPADGLAHRLTIEFDNEYGCKASYDLPVAPFSPVINSVTVSNVPTSVLCPAQDYTATITIETPYDATGRNIVLSGAKDTVVVATGTTTTFTITLDNIDGAAQSVYAVYQDAPNCTPTKSTTDLVPPTRVSCVKDVAVICEGEDYLWERHNHRYTAAELPVGVDTFSIGYDSLFVTVNAVPQVTVLQGEATCDTETQIRLPLSVVKGQPSDFSIDIKGTTYPATMEISGTDTVVVFSLNTMTAGDYSGTVTVSEAGATCSSTTGIYFTIAISGQMYSKWTDLLFINNKEGLYEGYQWYNNGQEIEGETYQRLYNPEGLPGTYHCRLLTKDGVFIYTCPQTFSEVPRSADNTPTPQQVRSTTTYDTMGRPINATPQKGIYIVLEELENGETRARKIAIYE